MIEDTFSFLPDDLTYDSLRQASAECRGCEIYKNATQTVFGEGDLSSGVVFIGEQPGDEEDLAGRPFVGPAGRLFDKALHEVGIDRRSIYVTNAVKHFKWKSAGKRRLHERPKASEIAACSPWLQSEIILLQPSILVCLGATAAQSLFGREFRVTEMRGRWFRSELAENSFATIHPSAILRTPGPERAVAFGGFVDDLAKVAELMRNAAKT